MKDRKEKSPSIFEYDNYRLFLQDFYQAKKANKKSFSFRSFAKKAGFNSPSFLKLVMDGKRNLSWESIEKFTQALILNKEEATYYKDLVGFNQAKTVDEKQQFAKKIVYSKAFRKLRPLDKAQYQYWSRWYHVVIREMVGLNSFREDPEWIAQKLCPPVTLEEAESSLKLLLELGFITRNYSGKLVQTETDIFSGDGVVSSSIEQFHREMIQKGSEALDRIKWNQRQISTVTFTLSETGAEKAKKMLEKFRNELIVLSNEEKQATSVYQVNFQLFPVTENSETKV